MNQVVFLVEGEPTGKGRPRFTNTGKHVYTPYKTAQYEELVGLSYRNVAHGYCFKSPVRVSIIACFKPPKRSKKIVQDMLLNTILPTKKPDVDNIAKIILDGLNNVAWLDDVQVVEMTVTKRYKEIPCVIVKIEEINAARC